MVTVPNLGIISDKTNIDIIYKFSQKENNKTTTICSACIFTAAGSKKVLPPQVGFTYMITLELNCILFLKYKLTLLKY
jgi:hypothetical protein